MSDLLKVTDLVTEIAGSGSPVRVVDHVSFSLAEGETFGLVGESGSGKSVTCRSILRLLQPPLRVTGGSAVFQGEDILKLKARDVYHLRGSGMSMIFQDPTTALNPVLTVEQQIVETLGGETPKNQRRERAIDLLRKVGIPSPEQRLRDYPHQFSGGMRQRVMIAIAIARNPRLLIADEPTTALDVTIQDQILKLLTQLQRESGMGLILVTHDLGVVAQVCDRVGVMYAGEIVEMATTAELFRQPRHPYTMGLLNSVPRAEAAESKLRPIPGSLPDPRQLPQGCRFQPRCPWASEECRRGSIPIIEVDGGHYTRCIRSDQLVGVTDFPASSKGMA
jgi:oligopeptide/dipeptide ABC transporter ATP-binding protein